ncbi:hypothetical protein MHYP_G00345750 [Metynnis hypsauchen]
MKRHLQLNPKPERLNTFSITSSITLCSLLLCARYKSAERAGAGRRSGDRERSGHRHLHSLAAPLRTCGGYWPLKRAARGHTNSKTPTSEEELSAA